MPRIIAVSNRLPIAISNNTITRTSGGLSSAMEGVAKDHDLTWIGWSGDFVDSESRRKDLEKEIREKCGFYPVFLTKDQIKKYYLGFSNSSVWPLFHYISTHANYNSTWIQAYRDVNQIFADKVCEIAESDNLIWVHDYHLMLLPALIREKRPELRIGFFLHTPFPSYEVFRCHPNRKEILEGLMGADLVGFHTFGYLRHFRSAILRIAGIESEMNCIYHSTHTTSIGVFPIGMNSSGFKHALNSTDYDKHLAECQKLYGEKKLVLSVERLDYTKGIPRKLQAIEKYLAENPADRDSVVFVIIAVPSREDISAYARLKRDVELSVGRINGQYSTISNIPVHFINQSIPIAQLCALYTSADACLVTPLMDGMNLVAKEFLACQTDDPGVLILSEFAGAAQELYSSITVNPYDIEEVSNAVKEALSLPLAERVATIEPMKKMVLNRDSAWWASLYLDELREEKDNPNQSSTVTLDKSVQDIFRNTNTRKALFLDYDGTLTEIVRDPAKAIPSAEVMDILEKLSRREDLDVYVVSGRTHTFLEKHLGELNVTLVSEHGFRVRPPTLEWELFEKQIDLSWMDSVELLLQQYATSTPGTAVERKTSAIVWHYRNADPEYGKFKAIELMGELMDAASNLPVEIKRGKKIIEVSSQQVSKGLVLAKYYQDFQYDAVLCAGDDQTDETMFLNANDSTYTIKIGRGDTAAAHRCASPEIFRKFLSALI